MIKTKNSMLYLKINILRLLQKSEKSFSVIVSLSNYDHKSNGYITLRQAQGDNSGVLQEPLLADDSKPCIEER